MNVLILSSASKNVDYYYLSIAKSISSYLAKNNFDLVFGASSTSMMGICYDEFINNNRCVYAFTTEKYKADLVNLDKAKHFILNNTFAMKENMYIASDLIVALPGGIGTLSEIFSYIEESRSNDNYKDIIIYNEGGFYNNVIDYLKKLIDEGFVNDEILNYFKIANNKNDFVNEIDNFICKERGKKYGK